jgi:tetratricopeptide (TPR) repeat protein
MLHLAALSTLLLSVPAFRADESAARKDPIADRSLAAFQVDLIDLAFRAAAKMPANPHVKTRSKLQDDVAQTCFDLDQPRRALHFVENIADWRRGKGYADFAFYCAKHGDPSEAQRYEDRALEVARNWVKDENAQDWHVDRIRTTLARAHLALGDLKKAAELEAGASDADAGKVQAMKASFMKPEAFDTEMELIHGMLAHGNFDQQKSAMETCAQLFDRFYDDVAKRTVAEEKIKTSWAKLPLEMRIELLSEIAEFALAHGDREKTLSLLDEALAITESAPWLPEDHIAIVSNLAALRCRAGDKDRARAEADAALSAFKTEREKIESFRRGRALRPLAEAFKTMDDAKASLAIYTIAVEEGRLNPNARARAEDLCANCQSMARSAVEPDPELWTNIRRIYDGLSDPW